MIEAKKEERMRRAQAYYEQHRGHGSDDEGSDSGQDSDDEWLIA